MQFDKLDSATFSQLDVDITDKLKGLSKGFESSVKPAADGVLQKIDTTLTDRLSDWLELDDTKSSTDEMKDWAADDPVPSATDWKDKVIDDTIPGKKEVVNPIFVAQDGKRLADSLEIDNDGILDKTTQEIDSRAVNIIGNRDEVKSSNTYDSASLLSNKNVYDFVKDMYAGMEKDGTHYLGLDEISNWTINPEYEYQNLKQHAGYAAEVVSTTKDNLKAKLKQTGLTTYRTDDLADDLVDELKDEFKKNDEHVDKVRVDANNKIVERIQVKFVGKDGASCLSKLMSSKYDKYFKEGKVDKFEIPKDYYDEIKKNGLIENEIEKLTKQVERATENGKLDVAEQKQARIDKLNKINDMLERSSVSSKEAMEAVTNPKSVTAKLFATQTLEVSVKEAKGEALEAGAITLAVTTVDNLQKYYAGEITAEEAFKDVAKDTGTAVGVGAGTGFVTSVVAQGMEHSSHTLIKSMARVGVPGAVVSFGVDSFDSVVDYAQGEIETSELVYDLGESATKVAGSTAGYVAAGAAMGSIVPGAGTVAGAAAGLVGGMVGTAVAAEAYKTAVQMGAPEASKLAAKAEGMAKSTVEAAEKTVPDKVGEVKNALNNFAAVNKLPFSV